MTPKKRLDWRTLALAACLLLSASALALSYRALGAPRLPDWIEIQEGPVAHGVDKFYRNAYFKGNVETAGDLTVAGTTDLGSDLELSGPVTLTGNVTLGDAITDTVSVYAQMRSYDGTDNLADVPDVSALGQTNGWQSGFNLTGWGGETSFQALLASMQVTATMLTTQTIYGAEGKAIFESVVGTGNASAIGLMGKVRAETTSTIPIAYPIYAKLETASASDYITSGANFMAGMDNSGTITTSRILYTEAVTWTYGLDLSQAIIETADIVLSNGNTIVNDAAGTITLTAGTVVTGALDVQGGDITLQNDETVSNSDDGVIQIGGFLALTAGDVLTATEGGYIITPTASYQPIDSDDQYTVTIADGSVTGQLLTIISQSSDLITATESAYNAVTGGDVVFTGSAYDSLSLLWDGTNWVRVNSVAN